MNWTLASSAESPDSQLLAGDVTQVNFSFCGNCGNTSYGLRLVQVALYSIMGMNLPRLPSTREQRWSFKHLHASPSNEFQHESLVHASFSQQVGHVHRNWGWTPVSTHT